MHADVDDCHARRQCFTDCPRHGKTYFHRQDKGKTGIRRLSAERKIERYARSFQRLAHTFMNCPIIRNNCLRWKCRRFFSGTEECMPGLSAERVLLGRDGASDEPEDFEMLQVIEDGDQDRILRAQGDWIGECRQAVKFMEALQKDF